MTKVVIIGAGSTVFTTELVTDILQAPGIPPGTIALVDIDSARLELAHRMAEHLVGLSGRRWSVEASTDRTRMLPEADYVINTIEVAGLANVRHDYDIPMKFGVDQCIGDTIGPGGIFKALRTLPAWMDILADIERLSPTSLIMNYTNPMSITVLVGRRVCRLPMVGLCHSIPNTILQLAVYLGLPANELYYRAAGVNHLAWITELTHRGQDLYPRLRAAAADPQVYAQDPVRFEMMLHLGAFVSESSGHSSEYVPYFRKRPELVRKYCAAGYLGESGYYANNWPTWRSENDEELSRILSGTEKAEFNRGVEYASYLMEAIETNTPAAIYGNVLNDGLIDNLAQDGVVEVRCLVDAAGVQPVHFGSLPTPLAALCQQHMAVHELVATAVLEQDRRAAFQALCLDPLTAAVCSLAEIRTLFEEMVAAEQADLPEWIHAREGA
jgi:alpha-galactosidase